MERPSPRWEQLWREDQRWEAELEYAAQCAKAYIEERRRKKPLAMMGPTRESPRPKKWMKKEMWRKAVEKKTGKQVLTRNEVIKKWMTKKQNEAITKRAQMKPLNRDRRLM